MDYSLFPRMFWQSMCVSGISAFLLTRHIECWRKARRALVGAKQALV